MTPFEFVQYVALEQLDLLAVQGVSRVMAGFARIEEEADEYENKVFESYGNSAGDADPGDFVDDAVNLAVEYYQLLSGLRQTMLNLLAAGLFHLFEQHREMVRGLLKKSGRDGPAIEDLTRWPKVDELRLVANTVKHGEGPSAAALRARRADLFMPPVIRLSAMAKRVVPRPVTTPLGGTDLYVSEADIQEYRDAIRQLWDDVRPVL